MKMKITQPYSNRFMGLDCLEIDIRTEKVTHDIAIDKLFTVGVRRNKKRIFLFISKVLGKHIAIDPLYVRLAGVLLADAYHANKEGKYLQKDELTSLFMEDDLNKIRAREVIDNLYSLKEKTLFIGFAETATGLGHSMFRAFKDNATFIHTTREPIIGKEPTFIFEEEHSHATSHACYTSDKEFFKRFNNIVLVDDEVTTGNTALNLIEALHEKCGAKKYSVVAVLDWRNKDQIDKANKLAEKLDIEIDFIAIVKGDMAYKITKELDEKMMLEPELLEYKLIEDRLEIDELRKNDDNDKDKISQDKIEKTKIDGNLVTILLDIETPYTYLTKAGDNKIRKLNYIDANGRFGIETKENQKYDELLENIGINLSKYRISSKTLCIGTEELIYIPARIAEAMGDGIKYQSTTRSPILTTTREDYPLNSVMAYNREEDQTVINYIYNILPDRYEEVFWFLEREYSQSFKKMIYNAFKQKGIKKVNFICFSNTAEEIYE